MSSKIKIKKIAVQTATYLFLNILALSVLYVIAIMVISAFKPGNIIAFKLDLNIKWSLMHFQRLFSATLFGRWYLNTIIIAFFTTAIQVSIVALAGYAFSRFRFAGKKQSMRFFIIVNMIPTMAALTAFYVMALLLNGFDSYWLITVIFVGGGIPINIWLMKGYFDTVSISLDESARIDGAGRLLTLVRIVLPLVKPMIAVQALWAFMSPFMEYMIPSLLLRSPEAATLAVGLRGFVAEPHLQQEGLFAAGSILTALPILALFFYLQRHFISGLAIGGVKE